jgi:hypothetical protein
MLNASILFPALDLLKEITSTKPVRRYGVSIMSNKYVSYIYICHQNK